MKQNSEISLKKSELANANEQILRLSDALENKATQLSSKDLEHEKQQAELQNLQSGTQALRQDCETHSRQNQMFVETQRQLLLQKENVSGQQADLRRD